jgi:hypothetical protein
MVIAVRITMMVAATLARAIVLRMIVERRLARLGKGRLLEKVMHPVRRRGGEKKHKGRCNTQPTEGTKGFDLGYHSVSRPILSNPFPV